MVNIQPLCALWAQMRIIRILIQQRRIGEPIAVYAKSFPAAAVALACGLFAIAFPSWLGLIMVTISTLVYNWELAPYEVDNGATWELAGSAFLCIGPLGSFLSGHSLNDGLVETMPYLKAGFACVYLFAAIAKLNKGMDLCTSML